MLSGVVLERRRVREEDRPRCHGPGTVPGHARLSGRGQRQLVVVGAGAAGLYTALRAAREGALVTLISATELAETSSYWAQGGLAAALAAEDSAELHLADTLRPAAAPCGPSAARVLVEEAPDAVEDLGRLGVMFDADRTGRLALGLEGGHSHRRIVHAGGAATGRRIVRQLSAVVAAERADRGARGPTRDRRC